MDIHDKIKHLKATGDIVDASLSTGNTAVNLEITPDKLTHWSVLALITWIQPTFPIYHLFRKESSNNWIIQFELK